MDSSHETEETQPKLDPLEKQRKLWKIFGRETAAGRELFGLYNISEKPKINYPKPKPRSQKEIDEEKERMAVIKKCPQKAQIEYPEPKKEEYVFHAVDSIPKRKNQTTIRKQIVAYYEQRKKHLPANRGVDRAKLVKKLQDQFNMQRGGLPKSVELPSVASMTFNEQKIKLQAKLKADKKGQTYSQPLKKKEDESKPAKEFKDEIDEIFDQIVCEIAQRQEYLESIEHLEEPKLKEKIKMEIIERVAQLQKITEMKK